ncbi:FlgD Ig-like domain-containing protein [Armatimonadetes bacterium GXS]|jgi:hypothetical protein|nr:FlgD Ig-like domain-containing protein [Armatimonadetes bacterium GXS]
MARTVFCWLLIGVLIASASAQIYRNVVNKPFAAVSNGPQNLVVVDIDRAGRSAEAIERLIRQRVEQVARAQIQGARPLIRLYKRYGFLPEDYRFPLIYAVALRRNGQLILPTRSRDGGLGNGTLSFEIVDGENPFPANYKNLLQQVLNVAPPLVEAEYGKPARTLTIQVVNYDDQIGDRDAVVGGIYDVSNNRFLFPIYNSPEAAAVNLVHLMTLAFHADVGFAFDVWEEGFARAVTARVARKAVFRTQLGLNPDFVERTLENTYDARPYYDAWNQPVLGSPAFIAPSLRQASIQGGTTGGIWLVRYLMAGSVWLKVAMEYPNFFRVFNQLYYQNYTPALRNDTSALINLARQALSQISGNPNPTVEGVPFEQWVRQQYILDTSVTYGRKLHAQLLPYVGEVQPGEEAVFVVFLTYFQTVRSGNSWDEALLNGTCYPIYWDFNLQRLTLSPQYERVDIRVGTGAVVPSFVGSDVANQRLTVDFSVGTEYAQVAFPSSKVQTATVRNNFFGVVYGLDDGIVEIQIGSERRTVEVTRGAFGASFPESVMNQEQVAQLVFYRAGEEVGRVQVNKGLGFQYVLVRLTSPAGSFRLQRGAGLQMISLPLRPYQTDMAQVLGIPASQLRLAHWRQERFNYVYYPETPPPAPGVGYFLRVPDGGIDRLIEGEAPPADRPFAIALQPGWNLIGMPFNAPVNVSDLQVVWQFDAPVSWETATESIGGQPPLVGNRIFTLGGVGGYVQATQLEPGKAYWVRVLRPEGVTLLIPPPANRSASRSRGDMEEPRPAWEMMLSLQSRAGGGVITLGLDSRASSRSAKWDSEMPPLLPDMLGFGVVSESGALQMRSVRPLGGRQVWELRVLPAEPESEHTLTWNLPPNTARRWRITLEDPTTGNRVDMRRQSFYRFVPSEGRTLRVVVEPSVAAPVRITQVRVAPTRGGNFTIEYQLTGEASVKAEIRSARGEVVRILQPARATRAGVQTLVWNGRDQQERALPPGAYQLHLEAIDADGRVARAVTPILLTR